MDSLPQEILKIILNLSMTNKADYILQNFVCKKWKRISAKVWHEKKKVIIKNYISNIINIHEIQKIHDILNLSYFFSSEEIRAVLMMLEKWMVAGHYISKQSGILTKNHLSNKYNSDPKRLTFINQLFGGMHINMKNNQNIIMSKGKLYTNNLFIYYNNFREISYNYTGIGINFSINALDEESYRTLLKFADAEYIDREIFEEILFEMAKYQNLEF
jgi:hypothetical protein